MAPRSYGTDYLQNINQLLCFQLKYFFFMTDTIPKKQRKSALESQTAGKGQLENRHFDQTHACALS